VVGLLFGFLCVFFCQSLRQCLVTAAIEGEINMQHWCCICDWTAISNSFPRQAQWSRTFSRSVWHSSEPGGQLVVDAIISTRETSENSHWRHVSLLRTCFPENYDLLAPSHSFDVLILQQSVRSNSLLWT